MFTNKPGLALALLKYGMATRMEKEISAGNINRSDVVPGSTDLVRGPLAAFDRKAARDALWAPAPRTEEQLARTRKLNEALFKQQRAYPPEGVTVHGIGLLPFSHVVPQPGGGTSASVNVPDTTANWARLLVKPDTLESFRLGGHLALRGSDALADLPPVLRLRGHPADPTLNQAFFRHELGEVDAAKGYISPVASHISTRPIHEENIALRGDPAAQAVMSKLRKIDSDDALVQRVIRQVGGRPDAPLAIGGRQEKAVERIMARKQQDLRSPIARKTALQFRAQGLDVPNLPADVDPRNVLRAKDTIQAALRDRRFRDIPAGLSSFGKSLARNLRYVTRGT